MATGNNPSPLRVTRKRHRAAQYSNPSGRFLPWTRRRNDREGGPLPDTCPLSLLWIFLVRARARNLSARNRSEREIRTSDVLRRRLFIHLEASREWNVPGGIARASEIVREISKGVSFSWGLAPRIEMGKV